MKTARAVLAALAALAALAVAVSAAAAIDCAELNRHGGTEAASCGACFRKHVNRTANGACRFLPLRASQTLAEEGGLANVATRLKALGLTRASFTLVDLNADGNLDVVAVGAGRPKSDRSYVFRAWTNKGLASASAETASRFDGSEDDPRPGILANIQDYPDYSEFGLDSDGDDLLPRLEFGANEDGRPGVAVMYSANNLVDMEIGKSVFLYVYDEASEALVQWEGDADQHPLKNFVTEQYTTALILHDFNGDGLPDIAAVTESGTSHDTVFFMNVGTKANPLWEEDPSLRETAANERLVGIAPIDVDGDGVTDVMYMGYHGDFKVRMNTGTSNEPKFAGMTDLSTIVNFDSSLTATCPQGDNTNCPTSLATGNLYGSSRPEVFVLNWNDVEVKEFGLVEEATAVTWPLGDESVSGIADLLRTYDPADLASVVPAFEDIDGDGFLDMVVGTRSSFVVDEWTAHYNITLKFLRNRGGLNYELVEGEQDPFAEVNYSIVDDSIWSSPETSISQAAFFDFVNQTSGIRQYFMAVTSDVPEKNGFLLFEKVNGRFVHREGLKDEMFPGWNVPTGASPSIQFVHLDNGGLQLVVAASDSADTSYGLRLYSFRFDPATETFVETDALYEFKSLKKDPVVEMLSPADGEDRKVNARIAFGDVDNDGDKDLLLGVFKGSLYIWENTGSADAPEFLEDSLQESETIKDYEYLLPAAADVDGDGDVDLFVIDGNGQVGMFSNPRFDCASSCAFGRGQCMAGDSSDAAVLTVFVRYEGLASKSQGIGKCLCDPEFTGSACEYCAAGRYGENCAEQCPDRSSTAIAPGSHIFMDWPTLEDCECDTTFELIDGACTCAPGYTYNSVTDTCVACARGTYKSEAGLAACAACPYGEYVDTYDNSDPSGAALVVTGAADVAMCKCKSSFVLEGDACTCGAGTEFDANAELCLQCAAGWFKADAGLEASCEECPAMYTTFSTGQSECELENCPAGHYRESAFAACEACPVGKYRGVEDSPYTCTPCSEKRPITNSSGSSSIDDCIAVAGSFAVTGFDDILTCDADPQLKLGADCDTAGISLETLPIKRHFWRIANTSIDVRKCPDSVYCEPPESAEGRRRLQTASEGDAYCSEFHTGTLCASCIEGYAKDGTFRCEACSTARTNADRARVAIWVILALAVVVAPAIYVYFLSAASPSNKANVSNSYLTSLIVKASACMSRSVRLCPGSDFVKLWWVAADYKKIIFLKFAQIVVEVSAIIGIMGAGGSAAEFLLNLNLGALLELFPMGCVFEIDLYTTVLVTTIWPVVSAFFVFLAVTVRRFRGDNAAKAQDLAVGVYTEFLAFIYPGVSSTILSVFVPDEIDVVYIPEASATDAGTSLFRALSRDPTINYDDSSSAAWRIYAGIMVLVYPIGVVLLFVLGFYLKHFRVEFERSSVQTLLVQAVSHLERPYREDYGWYACLELVRRLVLTSGFMLMQMTSFNDAATFFVALNILFVVMLTFCLPYNLYDDNFFAFLSHVLLCIFALEVQRVTEDDILAQRTDPFVAIVLALEFVFFIGTSLREALYFDPEIRKRVVSDDASTSDGKLPPKERPSADPSLDTDSVFLERASRAPPNSPLGSSRAVQQDWDVGADLEDGSVVMNEPHEGTLPATLSMIKASEVLEDDGEADLEDNAGRPTSFAKTPSKTGKLDLTQT